MERISVIVTPIVQLPGLIGRKQLKKIGGVLAVLNHFEIPGVAQLGFYLNTRQLKINPLIDLNSREFTPPLVIVFVTLHCGFVKQSI